jgi:hypothetical protein
MNRLTFRSFLVIAACSIVAAMPIASAGAQSITEPVLTPESIRAEYLAQGFQASTAITWWTNGSTTFTVEDPTEQNSPSARILMVIVYPDAASAEADHRAGAHLVPGYGPSVWWGNVALAQTTRSELARRYAAEVNNDDPSFVRTAATPEIVAEPSYPVGVDFVAVLQNSGTVNL